MSYKKIQNSLNTILVQINRFNKFDKKILYKHFNNKYSKELWFTLLYFSQIELTKNIQTVLNNKNPIVIPILVRSSLDLLIQMKMCNNDFKSLIANFKKNLSTDFDEYKKVISKINLKELSRSQLLIIANILNSPPINDEELFSHTMKKLQEVEKRHIANLEKDLDLSYTALSGHVHNSYSILAQRHSLQRKKSYMASGSKKINKSIIYYSIYTLTQVLFLTYVELIKCLHLSDNHNLQDLFSSIHACQIIASEHLEEII